MIPVLLFYIFSIIVISSSIFVVIVRNPVHSILCLILTFFSSAGLFLLIGAEFISMVLVIVYVGAVAVLFLFVVMMLNVNFDKLKNDIKKYNIVIVPIIFILIIDFYLIFEKSIIKLDTKQFKNQYVKINNTDMIGEILYTKYAIPLQIAGLILLVAMISSIVLTLRSRIGVKKQDRKAQLDRNKSNSIDMIKR
ncbi:MAG: NADH-quinone oxidoreductase subunit J [Rickettsiales bacterium]|nr:MAG: NADH-quinone oxidoreductase subunit J [Rickettsiales bacterium]